MRKISLVATLEIISRKCPVEISWPIKRLYLGGQLGGNFVVSYFNVSLQQLVPIPVQISTACRGL